MAETVLVGAPDVHVWSVLLGIAGTLVQTVGCAAGTQVRTAGAQLRAAAPVPVGFGLVLAAGTAVSSPKAHPVLVAVVNRGSAAAGNRTVAGGKDNAFGGTVYAACPLFVAVGKDRLAFVAHPLEYFWIGRWRLQHPGRLLDVRVQHKPHTIVVVHAPVPAAVDTVGVAVVAVPGDPFVEKDLVGVA